MKIVNVFMPATDLMSFLIQGLRVNPRLTEEQRLEVGMHRIDWLDSLTGKKGKAVYVHSTDDCLNYDSLDWHEHYD
jgi:hypothetical protein